MSEAKSDDESEAGTKMWQSRETVRTGNEAKRGNIEEAARIVLVQAPHHGVASVERH